MLTLRLSFPWGRYYAHPWGQNPARITEAEWPPSPWRLLRAIAAAWFQANPGRDASTELIQTLEVLGRELPDFILPKVSFSRTVHYQPNYGATPKADVALAKYKRVRHENHFVSVGGDVLVRWRLPEVSDNTTNTIRSLVDTIAGRIGYFGRAESVCEVEVVDAVNDNQDVATVTVQAGKPCRQIGSGFRDVFCTNPADFRATDLWQRRADSTASENARKHLVQDLLDAPQPLPDGAAWFSYRMPPGWPEHWVVRHAKPAKRKVAKHRIVARFLEFSLQCRIPVPTKFTVSIAELFRAEAIEKHRLPSFALSGHDRPPGYETGHHHAFYLPIPDDSGQYLSRLQVWCPYGFTQQEVNSLMGVGALRWAGGRFPVRPVLLQLQRDLPERHASRMWRSITPFVPPRYWYRKKFAEGRVREPDSPENQFRACLRDNGVEALPARIERVEFADTTWDVCKVHLPQQSLLTNAEPDHRVGVFLITEFAEPIVMPFPSFGHSCHFGLGQFAAVDE
ncbi:MAG TPA: type I-U CRISPR-associated protein Csb2 [Gemmataceae bacterium]|nr:type I-U CRISPR-associated protein Csb2 [Gemmataceae bacterium]